MKKHHHVPSKLPATVADQIRRRHAEGESASALAKEFKLARTSFYDVIAGRKFAHKITVRLSPEHAAFLDRQCGKFKGEDRQTLVDSVFSVGLEALAAEDAAAPPY